MLRLDGHADQVFRVAFHPDGNFLATQSYDGTTRFWDCIRGRQLLRVPVGAAKFSRDGKRVAFGRGYSTVVSNSDEHCLLQQPLVGSSRSSTVQQFDVHPGGRLLLACGTQLVVWDLAHKRIVATAQIDLGLSRFDHTGENLLTFTREHRVRRWPIRRTETDEKILFKIGPPELIGGPPRGLSAVSQTGLLVTAAYYRQPVQIAVTDLNTAKTTRLLPHHRNAKFIDITRDGRFVATGTWHGHDVHVWETANGKLIKTLPASNAWVGFSPSGQQLLIGEGLRYSVWNTENWQLQHQTSNSPGNGHPLPAAFSPDGALVAILKTKRMVQLRASESFEPIATFPLPEDQNVYSLAFTPDGSRLIIGATDNPIHIWDLHALRKRLVHVH